MGNCPRVVDQIVGAVARAVVANISKVPVEEMVTAVLANLPLKEDMDEHGIVFKFFSTLLLAQHPTFPSCLSKIVECAAAFFTSPATDKEKTSPQAVSLLKQTAISFGGEMQQLVSALPAQQGQLLAYPVVKAVADSYIQILPNISMFLMLPMLFQLLVKEIS